MPVPAVLIDWPNAEMAVLRLPGGPLTALTHDMLDELSAGLAEAAARPATTASPCWPAGRPRPPGRRMRQLILVSGRR